MALCTPCCSWCGRSDSHKIALICESDAITKELFPSVSVVVKLRNRRSENRGSSRTGGEEIKKWSFTSTNTEAGSELWCKTFRKLVCKLVVELDWKTYYSDKLVPPLPWNKFTSNNVHFLTSWARKTQCQACFEQACVSSLHCYIVTDTTKPSAKYDRFIRTSWRTLRKVEV